MGNYTFGTCKDDYTAHWTDVAIDDHRRHEFESASELIVLGKDRYLPLQEQTGIPWYFIGLLHYRESNCNFHTHLHNGDKLTDRTKHVPRNRPSKGNPPFTFEYSALDALDDYKGQDWTTDVIEKIAYNSEKFNGFGYRAHGVPSAYLWAGTNQYHRGKYVADGVWSADTVDSQLGCMGILKIILDTTNEVTIAHEEKPVDSPKATGETLSNTEMNEVSNKHYATDLVQKTAVAGAAGAGGLQVLQSVDLEQTRSTVSTIKSIATMVGIYGVAALCVGLVVYAAYMKWWIKKDLTEGRYTPSGSK